MTDSTIATRLALLADELRDASRVKVKHSIAVERGKLMAAAAELLYGIVADLDAPAAGTTAYEMVAATAQAQVGVTETLIHMTAATVLSVLIDEEGGGRANVSFSPKNMDEMHRRYEMDAKHDGMLTTVSIKPRDGMFESLALVRDLATPLPPLDANLERKPEAEMNVAEPEAPAKVQADVHVYDRPLWGTRYAAKLYPASDRAAAERLVVRFGDMATIENRFCYHDDCPASGCNHQPEATSETVDTPDA